MLRTAVIGKSLLHVLDSMRASPLAKTMHLLASERALMSTRNIRLTDHDDQFVEQQVNAGHFRDANEVLRAGLRLLKHQAEIDDQKLILLRNLAQAGFDQLDQGQGLVAESEQSLKDMLAHLGSEALQQAAQFDKAFASTAKPQPEQQ